MKGISSRAVGVGLRATSPRLVSWQSLAICHQAQCASRTFELGTHFGYTDLENSCPTVSEELGLQLIKEIEKQVIMLQKARLAVLRGGEGPGMASMSKTTVEWFFESFSRGAASICLGIGV